MENNRDVDEEIRILLEKIKESELGSEEFSSAVAELKVLKELKALDISEDQHFLDIEKFEHQKIMDEKKLEVEKNSKKLDILKTMATFGGTGFLAWLVSRLENDTLLPQKPWSLVMDFFRKG